MPAKKTSKPAPSKTRTSPQRKKEAEKGGGVELVDLSPDQVKALPHPREGFDKHVGSLLALAREFGDEIVLKTYTPDEAEVDFRAWQSLEPVERSAAKHLEIVKETRLLRSSRVWKTMLTIYAKAQAAGRENSAIKARIADFEKYMKTGPREKKPQ